MNVKEELGDALLHFGWALYGQECDCGSNPFNWLAKLLAPWMNDEAAWTGWEDATNDDDFPRGHVRRAVGKVGNWFVDAGTNLTC